MEEGANVWQVYMLQCKDGSYYTGITNKLDERLETHSLGKGSKYVASRRPFSLVYSEPLESKSEALKREYAIKQLSHAEKQSLVKNEPLFKA